MSAYYIVTYPHRIEMLTDGAVYTHAGVLLKTTTKVWSSDVFPLAITGRGDCDILNVMARAMLVTAQIFGNFDDALPGMQLWFDDLKAKSDGKEVRNHIEMIIAGISDIYGPMLLYVASISAYGDSYEPWKIVDCPAEFLGGLDAEDVPGVVERSGLSAESIANGIAEIGPALFGEMRKIAMHNPTMPDLPKVFGIGGHIDHTIIAPSGVRTRRVYTWPDEIGKLIDPFKVEPAADHVSREEH